MNIIIPMAGRGSRFATQGVETPKPLISVAGRPMIAWALESLGDLLPGAQVVFVALREHETNYGISELLHTLAGPSAQVVLLDDVTEGQLCTVMAGIMQSTFTAASSHINLDEDLLVASCDTYIVSNLAQDIQARSVGCHGIISVADMSGGRWSFARTDETGHVAEVAEKVRISNHASTGLYYFSKTQEFVDIGNEIIRNQEMTRGEYYVIPVYQKYIQRGWQVDISVAGQMWDMGTPEALEMFIHKAPAVISSDSAPQEAPQ